MKKLWNIFSALFTATFVAGCASGGALLTATPDAVQTVVASAAPVVSTVTNVVTVTNIVGQIVTETNRVTVTNTVPILMTNWQTNVEYAPSKTATTILATMGAANTLTGPLDPFAGAISAVLALSTAALGWYAKQKSNQVNAHAGTIATLTTAAASLEPAAAAAFHAAVVAQSGTQGAAAMIQSTAAAAAQNLSS
jgi:hypothetical protein